MSVKHAVYRSLSLAHRALRPPAGPGLRVLMYHSVGGGVVGDPYGISISPGLFRDHLRRLAGRSDLSFRHFGPASAGKAELALTFDDGFKDTLTAAAPAAAEHGLPITVFVTAGHVRSPGALYLSLADLRELGAMPGVLVGAHGATHRPLDALSDEELSRELSDSRKFLEDALGREVRTMSYPHGRVDRRVRDAAAAAGFTAAGCSRYGLNGPGRDPLLLCRTEITAWDTVGDLELKTEGHWDWFRLRHPDPARK